MNLSHAIVKNCLLFHLFSIVLNHLIKTKYPQNGILLKGVLVPSWLNKTLASKSIIFLLLVLETLGFMLSVYFLRFEQYDKNCLIMHLQHIYI